MLSMLMSRMNMPLVQGIIDILQTWNWSKRLELFAKQYIKMVCAWHVCCMCVMNGWCGDVMCE